MTRQGRPTIVSLHNCTLQLDGFNEGKSRWQGSSILLEQHAKKDERKMVVFTGPVLLRFRSYLPQFVDELLTRIPLAFLEGCCLRREDGRWRHRIKLGQEDSQIFPAFLRSSMWVWPRCNIGTAGSYRSEFRNLATKDHFAEGGDPGTLEIARPEGGKTQD